MARATSRTLAPRGGGGEGEGLCPSTERCACTSSCRAAHSRTSTSRPPHAHALVTNASGARAAPRPLASTKRGNQRPTPEGSLRASAPENLGVWCRAASPSRGKAHATTQTHDARKVPAAVIGVAPAVARASKPESFSNLCKGREVRACGGRNGSPARLHHGPGGGGGRPASGLGAPTQQSSASGGVGRARENAPAQSEAQPPAEPAMDPASRPAVPHSLRACWPGAAGTRRTATETGRRCTSSHEPPWPRLAKPGWAHPWRGLRGDARPGTLSPGEAHLTTAVGSGCPEPPCPMWQRRGASSGGDS